VIKSQNAVIFILVDKFGYKIPQPHFILTYVNTFVGGNIQDGDILPVVKLKRSKTLYRLRRAITYGDFFGFTFNTNARAKKFRKPSFPIGLAIRLL